jgi:Carboxypeptidase regulatory-like domain
MAVLCLALAAQLPETPPSSIVAGRVVDATTGRPIAGVIVTPAGSAAAVAAPNSQGPARVLTNANGNFVLRGLAKGSLVLTGTKGGYVNATYGQRRPGGSTQPIPIDTDQRITDIELRMWKFGAITGTILDEAGDPVVGTRVSAMPKTFVAGRRRVKPGPTTTTDDRGIYRIGGLTPGDYVIMVPSTQTTVPTDVMESFFSGTPITDAKRMELGRELNLIGSAIAPAGSQFAMKAGAQTFSLQPGTMTPIVSATGTMIYPTAYYPAAATAGQAAVITLRSGEERGGIDLQVRPVRGVRVSGTIIGPDGPSATTGVRLGLAGSDEATEPLDVATTITDATGAFTFAAVPAGQYVLRVVRLPRPPINVEDMTRVSVVPSGGMTISSTPQPPAGPPPIPPDATLVAQMPLSLADRDLADLIVTLSAGPRVTGRLEFEGTIEHPPTSSITGMRITLDPSDGSLPADPTLATETGRPDENGQFKTYGVPPGRYVLRVNPLPAGWFLKSAIYQNRDLADLPIDLESKDVNGVVLTFTDRPSSVAGTVRGADGPDPTAVVLAYPIDTTAWSSSGALSRRMRTARAAKDGAYAIQGLPAGEYYLVAVQEDRVGEWQDPALLTALSRFAQTIRLGDGEQKTQNLTSAALR